MRSKANFIPPTQSPQKINPIIMRLFKSRKSGEYSDVSSVVANENDPSVKIVSCNSQQEFHNNANFIQNGSATTAADNNNQQQQQSDANDNFPNGQLNEQQKKHIHHHNIPYSLKSSVTCTDKFTPIPDCDQLDEPTNNQYDETSSDNSSTATTTTESTTSATMPSESTAEAEGMTTMTTTTIMTMATMQETKLHSDSTSDFINELFGTLLSIHISPSIHIVFHLFSSKENAIQHSLYEKSVSYGKKKNV